MSEYEFKDAVAQSCEQFTPERDFGYGLLRFTDIDRAVVRVQGSSAAMRHCVRIFVNPPEDQLTPTETPNGTVIPAAKPVALHLCRGMASELKYALERFLAEPVEASLRCDLTVYPPDGMTRVVESGNTWTAVCACGQVLEGDAHDSGETRWNHLGRNSFTSSITLWGTPGNQDAIKHFGSCQAHRDQLPHKRTDVLVRHR